MSLTEGARPPRVDSIGRLSFVLESASAVVGCALQFNPFEPPQLRPSKDKAAGALEQSAIAVGDAGKRGSALIEGLEPPAYLVIMGYRRYSDAVGVAVGRLRAAVRGASGAAATFGHVSPAFRRPAQQGWPCDRGVPAVRPGTRPGPRGPGRGYLFRRVIDTRVQPDLSVLGDQGPKVARVRLCGDDWAGVIDELVATLGKGSE